MKTLNDLFQDTIRDIYNSEQQILKGLQQMIQAAQGSELKEALEDHYNETQEQVRRIQEVARQGNFDPNGVICQATVGLIKEAQEHLQEFGGSPAGDAAIIACAQKIEHYEMANYGSAVEFAKQLDMDDAADLLGKTLSEEENADKRLTKVAEHHSNKEAEQGRASMR